MPLTPRGKKIMKSMQERYGKKKGEQVFYATKNKGKLKGVEKAYLGKAIKQPTETKKEFQMRHAYHTPFMKKPKGFKGGGADMGDPGKAEERAKKGYGSTGGVDRSKVGEGSQYAKNVAAKSSNQVSNQVSTQKKNTVPRITSFKQTFFSPTPFVGLNIMKNLVFDPLQKKTRTQKAKGETLFGRAKDLPATRDYYKTTGKPLDVMSPEGEKYMKDAGLIKPVKPPKVDTGGGSGGNLCPDGSLPPCVKPAVTKAPTTSESSSSFLKDFIFYPLKNGGVSSGPPPKKGPNSQVPPVKLSRGGGAAIRGTKFKGVF